MSIDSYYNKKIVVSRPSYQNDEIGGRERVDEEIEAIACRTRNLSGIESENLRRNSNETFFRAYVPPGSDIQELDKIRLETLDDIILIKDAEVRRVNPPAQTSLTHHLELDVVFKT